MFLVYPARVRHRLVVFVELAVGAVALRKGPAHKDGDSVGGAGVGGDPRVIADP